MARLVMIGGVCHRLSSVMRRICNVTHQGAACGAPVVLRPVRATPCYIQAGARLWFIYNKAWPSVRPPTRPSARPPAVSHVPGQTNSPTDVQPRELTISNRRAEIHRKT